MFTSVCDVSCSNFVRLQHSKRRALGNWDLIPIAFNYKLSWPLPGYVDICLKLFDIETSYPQYVLAAVSNGLPDPPFINKNWAAADFKVHNFISCVVLMLIC